MPADELAKREEKEKELIRLIQKNKNFVHEFDDCGTLKETPEDITAFVLNFKEDILKQIPETEQKFSDAFFVLHYNREKDVDISKQIEKVNDWLASRNLTIKKGDIGFVSSIPYGILVLTTPTKDKSSGLVERIGTIDSITEGKDFRTTQDYRHSGFYGCCAALSDIGANGAAPTKLHLLMINPSAKSEEFIHGVKGAADYCKVNEFYPVQTVIDKNLGDFCAVFTAIGEAPHEKQLKLTGLEENMTIYVAGTIGVSSAADYYIPKEHLMNNLNPEFRQQLFSSLSKGSLCNDVSDGFDKSARNLLRNSHGLEIQIKTEDLLKAGKDNPWFEVSLDNIKFGGDDYCLVIATHDELFGEHIYKVGQVVKGEKLVFYS